MQERQSHHWPACGISFRIRSSCWRRRTRLNRKVPTHCPEAQQDRFMFKVFVEYPSFAEEKQIAKSVRRCCRIRRHQSGPCVDWRRDSSRCSKIVRRGAGHRSHRRRIRLRPRAADPHRRSDEPGAPEFVNEHGSAWGAGPRAVQNLIARRKGAGTCLNGRTSRLDRRAGSACARASPCCGIALSPTSPRKAKA